MDFFCQNAQQAGSTATDASSAPVEGFAVTVAKIIDDLNRIFDTRFKSGTKQTQGLIRARLKEGFTVEDFFAVHRYISRDPQWKQRRMQAYIRPKTIYAAGNFEGYLNASRRSGSHRRASLEDYRKGG